jgi:hypothetical protein
MIRVNHARRPRKQDGRQNLFFKILQALSQQEYMTNNNNSIYNVTNVTGNHSFGPITVIPRFITPIYYYKE